MATPPYPKPLKVVFTCGPDDGTAPFEFHISRLCREAYGFDRKLYSTNGNVIFADLAAVRDFCDRLNRRREKSHISSAALNAMALIDEILHAVVARYREEINPELWERTGRFLAERIGERPVSDLLLDFVDIFPPAAVFQGRQTSRAYLAGRIGKTPHRDISLEELLLVSLANENPAFQPFRDLFDDRLLSHAATYGTIKAALEEFLKTQPTFGPLRQHLLDLLRAPMRAAPDSLSGQLDYIRKHWRNLLPGGRLSRLMKKLLRGLDVLKEETVRFQPGAGPTVVPVYETSDHTGDHPVGDTISFTPDTDWMPGVVMTAKHTYVWLDQLSRRYGRPIRRIDEIPDEELARLAGWGINALWLIGIWERSRASQLIKQRCGNPEALPSAYSIYDYSVAEDLGGIAAFERLKERGWRYHIRIAVDMVPNHTGIVSRWVIEHPNWFIQTDQPPFSRYSFNGPDLSQDPRVGVFLEDGYWDRSDAAVVFKHVDRSSGQVRYIFHGNDGTGMPWNDTAQLNFLMAEVREAVIREVLKVARLSPIIRLDAAMVLTKKHYQRLWFPEPGTGGDIPARAEHGLNKRQFNRLLPNEFWRDVVDRVNREAPDCLLLAEAFWLLETFFVRTLGMHRVYNSAFMNMLKNEENGKYRALIRNTLEYNPEILKRYVNFMSNPDELSAQTLFGSGLKFFGVTVMMSTLPGLPMFGHGQIEGFSEKYGMEYRRAYAPEEADPHLIQRHEREVFPLLHKRRLFSGVEHFLLYDLHDAADRVNEDVFAYSNRRDNERALVVFNNQNREARGWLKETTATGGPIPPRSIADGLGLHNGRDVFYSFRDLRTDLTYIRSGAEITAHGLYVKLSAYQYHVFTDFQEIREPEAGDYLKLCAFLNGQGTQDLEEARQEMRHAVVLGAFRTVMSPDALPALLRLADPDLFVLQVIPLYEAVKKYTAAGVEAQPLTYVLGEIWKIMNYDLNMILYEPDERLKPTAEYIKTMVPVEKRKKLLCTWLIMQGLGRLKTAQEFGKVSALWFDQWLFSKTVRETLGTLGWEDVDAVKSIRLLRILIGLAHAIAPQGDITGLTRQALGNGEARAFLAVNQYDGVWWFNKELFEELLGWLFVLQAVTILHRQLPDRESASTLIAGQFDTLSRIRQKAVETGYRWDDLRQWLDQS